MFARRHGIWTLGLVGQTSVVPNVMSPVRQLLRKRAIGPAVRPSLVFHTSQHARAARSWQGRSCRGSVSVGPRAGLKRSRLGLGSLHFSRAWGPGRGLASGTNFFAEESSCQIGASGNQAVAIMPQYMRRFSFKQAGCILAIAGLGIRLARRAGMPSVGQIPSSAVCAPSGIQVLHQGWNTKLAAHRFPSTAPQTLKNWSKVRDKFREEVSSCGP